MTTILLTAIAAYIATSIDYFVILLIFFSRERRMKSVFGFVIGHYLGMFILYGVSLLAAYGVRFIPESWIIGFLGLVPIGLGLKVAFQKEKDTDEEERVEKIEEKTKLHTWALVFSALLLTVATGGDDLGVFIPLFASYHIVEILWTLLVFLFCIAILCFLSYRLSRFHLIREKLEKYERILVPIVFIAIGLFVLWENGTILKLMSFFH